MKRKKYIVVQNSMGIRCPRCNTLAEARAHKEITNKQLNQPFYFTQWFNCTNKSCQTTIFMKDENKVMNKNSAAKTFKTNTDTLKDYDLFRDELNNKLKSLGL